ncbi:MAG: hypothetical protein RIS47_1076 [Bacteroidota bacterium]
MKKLWFVCLAILGLVWACGKSPADVKNAALSADKRAEALLAQMTLSEKIAQIQNYAYPTIARYVDAKGNVNADSLKKYFPDGIGGFNIAFGLDPEVYVNVANSLQKYNASTRLGVPVVLVGEGLHGLMSNGATVYPQAIALGSTWDTTLLEKVYSATALEARVRGISQLLSPVLDLGREPRFGRIEEMYSEDAYLVGAYGRAAIYGFQGRTSLPDSVHVAATLKHFMGHGMPEGGRNIAPVNVSGYDLLNEHLLPFEMCLQAGAMAVMPSYNEINGVPNHGSQWMLVDVLRGKLGFSGLITADQNAIDAMQTTHHIVDSPDDAARLALTNGIDVDLVYTSGTFSRLDSMVKQGKIAVGLIDKAVLRVLKLKFQLGLFENPYVSAERMRQFTNTPAHKELALQAATESAVLLKNENNVLPLDTNKVRTVAVIGPMAKGCHFGGYTAEPRQGVDLVDGFTQFGGQKLKVLYAEGCKIATEESSFWVDKVQTPNSDEDDLRLINEALKVAAQADVVILAIGENVAFAREAWAESHLGDRANLDLVGHQYQLVAALQKLGKPVVAVMFGGRPLSFNAVAQSVPAIFQVYYPGQEGGHAIANLVFGVSNPSGKLAITIPKSVGQLPCYYSRKPSRLRSYIYNLGSEPLYPFGFGLSYASFSYGKPTLNKTEMAADGQLTLSVSITNTSQRTGSEVVQLYIHDLTSTGVRPIMELKDFARVEIPAGQTGKLSFRITPDKLAYYNPAYEKVIEPGEFEVFVGSNSANLQSLKFTVK